MQEVLISIFAIGVGALFCFAGYAMMRLLFPLWGLIAGYWLGAQLIYSVTDDGFLSTTLAVVTGIIFGVVGALLAYAYFSAAILLFMGIVGFWLGAGLFNLLGFDLGVVSALVGLALAITFVLAGLMYNAPKYYLLVITAFAGAALAISGVLVLINSVDIFALRDGAFNVVAESNLFWQLVWVAVGLAGFGSQVTASREAELNWEKEWKGGWKYGN